MNRILLAICLSLGAGLVMAAPAPTNNDAPDQECPRVTAKAAIAAQANATQTTTSTTATTPPARARNGGGTTRMVSPRWHSLLPGMFR
jgi:hypothetical protein